MSKYILLD